MNRFAKRPLGRTNISVSVLGFGGASMGNLYHPISDEAAANTIELSIEAGFRYFDTAPYYGFGLSERRIGDILRNGPRDDFVLSTKVGRLLKPYDGPCDGPRCDFYSPMPFTPEFDYSYDAIMRSYEQSLQRLGLSRIDILLVHDIGKLTHGADHSTHYQDFVSGGYRALEELRRAGDIQAVGLGVNETEICETLMQVGQFDCFLLAGRYTMLEQDALDSMLPKCAEHGASVIIGGAYNSGILATGTRGGKQVHYNYAPAPDSVIQKVQKMETLCDYFDIPLAAAALQFPLAHPQIACVIPGMGNERRIQQTIKLFETPIAAEFWDKMKSQGLIREDAPVPLAGDNTTADDQVTCA